MSFITLANSGNTIQIQAEQDGAWNNIVANGENLIFEGIGNEFVITSSASSLGVSIGSGEGVICGRTIKATASNTITLTANTTTYLCLRVDLTQTYGNEGQLVALTSLSQMQSDDLNNGGSKNDMLLYTIVTGVNGVTSSTDNRTISSGVSGKSTEVSISTSDWTQSTYGYYATKSVTGVKSSSKIRFSTQVDMTSANYQAQIDARNYLQDVVSGNGTVTFYVTDLPTINIVVDIWGY